MTIREAIGRVDGLKYNTYTDAEKAAWLSELDGRVKALILDTCQGPEVDFPGYDQDTDPDRVLLAAAPFEELYLRWLEARVDYANGEYDKYNNSMAMFQAVWEAYRNHYIRTHMPKITAMHYF